ncbi:lipoyl(octanoyl) transferase LipB [Stenotrophobium rhamnosiphilum]|uniref:Octanoyltransferase n=1 Tax=Stenotrophobium rhamnosiphilum TaxID=2029166 RepID=A0A2T5MDI4_9GAMM|nr:lipoyl(octanoyl) transferase LipB [Stenotrophobium rhamnosiphilum]PTU30638.1 octanoyltransferase [Stenotrophobium rhamnosiphilum]
MSSPIIRQLGLRPYAETFEAMRTFTQTRTEETPDEIWFLEHPPVFTQGQAGKPEHLLLPGDIPVVQSDRGGQVTYHGPGQSVVYFLIDLQRRGYGIRSLVTRLEDAIIATLAGYNIEAAARRDAPGVYVKGDKIASLGLRVRSARTYHGLSLNVKMDMEPFSRINPCGYEGLHMTQVSTLGGPSDLARVNADLEIALLRALGYTS